MSYALHWGSWSSLVLVLGTLACQSSGGADPEVRAQVVEASCGECQFGLSGDSCDLAVRIDGVAYFVDGASTDEHGDAHASDGVCNVIRQAVVEGQVVDGRFVATQFKMLPYEGEPAPGKARLGVALALSENGLVIDRVLAGSPAEAAGLMKGDVVAAINGVAAAGLERDELLGLLNNNPSVRFSILRDGEAREIEVQLEGE